MRLYEVSWGLGPCSRNFCCYFIVAGGLGSFHTRCVLRASHNKLTLTRVGTSRTGTHPV